MAFDQGEGPVRLFGDSFARPVKVGQVDQSQSPEGATRLVTDLEGKVLVDHLALRMRPLQAPGYGRASLAYGPYERSNGRVLHFRVLVGDWQQEPDSLALGVFAQPNPSNPLVGSNALVFKNNGPLCGTIAYGAQEGMLESELQHFQTEMDAYVVLREQGAVYMLGGLPGGPMAASPKATPVGLDQSQTFKEVFATLTSRGQGYDHRLRYAQLVDVPAWGNWYATAHAADSLTGRGTLGTASIGGEWQLSGSLSRGPDGAFSHDGSAASAILEPKAPSQLVAAKIITAEQPQTVQFYFRRKGDSYWMVQLEENRVVLVKVQDGKAEEVEQTGGKRLEANHTHQVQVLDTGDSFRVFVDGAGVFYRRSNSLAAQTEIGFGLEDGPASGSSVQYLEAHPREVMLPQLLQLPPVFQTRGNKVVAGDDFAGPAGPLSGRKTPSGGLVWKQSLGKEPLVLGGNGLAEVRGAPSDFVLYGLPWPDSKFADLEATLIPPGTAYDQGQTMFAGVYFKQDHNTMLLVRARINDDQTDNAEYEWLLMRRGQVEVNRRVALGERIKHGKPMLMRVSTNGEDIVGWLDGVPVQTFRWGDVYPGDPPLQIREVGIWYDHPDNGGLLDRFVARGN
jgi:hypothetical protein